MEKLMIICPTILVVNCVSADIYIDDGPHY